jgi:small subunit ribosomal protein S9
MCAKKETIEKVKSKKKENREKVKEQESEDLTKNKKIKTKKNSVEKEEKGINEKVKSVTKTEKTTVAKKTVKKEKLEVDKKGGKEEEIKKTVKTSKQPKVKKEKVVKIKNKEKKFVTVGKRKTSIARVFMQKGSGNIFINNKELKEFFPNSFLSYKVLQPLEFIKWEKNFDITVNVLGGGINSQAEAIRLGISKNLPNFNPDYKLGLRELGFLTRDSRIVERKKFGHKKARRSFQFSKR